MPSVTDLLDLPDTPEARLFDWLRRQPGAEELVNGPDQGVSVVSGNGSRGAYFLRPNGTSYVQDAARNERPGALIELLVWWRGREAEAVLERAPGAAANDSAEAAGDALIEALPDQCRARPDRAYDDDVIDALVALRRGHPERWDTLETVLRTIRGVRLRTLRDRMNRRAAALVREQTERDAAAGYDDAGDGRMSQADRLIGLVPTDMLFVGVREEADSANSASGEVYVAMTIETHRETWPLRSGAFRHWLVQKYLAANRRAPNSDAIKQAIDTLDALGRRPESARRVIYLRTARTGDSTWIDLCDPLWRAIEVTREGWNLVENPSVHFRRTVGMLPLPDPVRPVPVQADDMSPEEALRRGRCRELAEYRSVLNLPEGEEGDDLFTLLVMFTAHSLSGCGPYMVAVFNGEQGSAKSTAAKVVHSLIDPNRVTLRSEPRNAETVRTAAANAFLLSYNNLTRLPGWLSDMFSGISTGTADSARGLYTNAEEFVVDMLAPIILNGIPDFVDRPDLGERGLFFILRRIPPERRTTERSLKPRIAAMRPKVFGALLDGLVEARRNEEREVSDLPRMADFAEFGMKCETAYWPPGRFARAYAKNRKEVGEAMLDADTMTTVLRRWWADGRGTRWEGTASELLAALRGEATEGERAAPGWPKDHRALGQMLRRAMPLLREQDIEVNPNHWSHSRRRIVILSLAQNGLAMAPASDGQDVTPTSHTFESPSVLVEGDPGAQSEDDYRH